MVRWNLLFDELVGVGFLFVFFIRIGFMVIFVFDDVLKVFGVLKVL